MRRAGLLVFAISVGCASSAPTKSPAPAASGSPYDTPSPAPHAIQISIDSRPAREILDSLSRPRLELSDVKVLEDLPAVRLTIQDSGRPAEVFERDFAAAFDENARTAVFDFHGIREKRERWRVLLAALDARRADLARVAARRAVSLLPSDRAVSTSVDVSISFGIAGLADHLVSGSGGHRELMVVDLARTLGQSEGESLDGELARVSRLIAGEAFRDAWAAYRETSAAWSRPDPALGEMDLFLRTVAESGPVSLFAIDENFFPLAVWLKEPMRRALEDFNRRADRVSEAQGNLEARVELTAEMRRPDFRRRIAGPAGAFLTDGIVETLGMEAFRVALAKGPRAFFESYDRAAQANRALPPLAKAIRDRLAHS